MQGETAFVIAADHPAFAGHFPGRPILPGVVLLDEAVHALRAAQGPAAGLPCTINSAKFLSPVGPGEALTITCRTSVSGSIFFEISGGNRKVAEGTLVPAP